MKSTLYRTAVAGMLTLSFLLTAIFAMAEPGYAQSSTEWSEPVNISNSGASSDPSIVVSSDGTIHVIWVDAVDGYKYSKSKDGKNWSDPVTVEFPFNRIEDSRPRLIADSSGSIHIFWTREVILGEGTDRQTRNNNLMYARTGADFLSQPLSWAAVEKLADSVLDFDAYVDARNSLHLSFAGSQAIGNAPAGIFYRRLDSGSNWAPPVSLYSSQYFRTLQLEDSHVRITATGGAGSADVYVVWDDRSVKRIFLAKSSDGGKNWGDAVQLQGPEDVSGLSLPFSINVNVIGQNVLLTWQSGQPRTLCSQYSQWSVDGAITFSDPKRISDEAIQCPSNSAFVGTAPGFSTRLLDIFGDFFLQAWNGTDWSAMQAQPEITTFSNARTLGSVILGCRQVVSHADTIYVVGCDEAGGDIWIRYRHLGTLNDWFPPASAWAGPNPVTIVNQEISSTSAIADTNSGLHAFWMQSAMDENGNSSSTLQYIRWENDRWSNPVNVLNGLDGVPFHLAAATDAQGGLLLAWVVGNNGDVYFTRANGNKAYLASEWMAPVLIPSLSELNTTPDMVSDASNRIILVYSIPYNENRGIYLVHSTDFGRTWSTPSRVFDAVAANWDAVVQPEIELSADGRLHLLFTRNSLQDVGQEAGLYYMQSGDGGGTWTVPEPINDGNVRWSRMVHTGGNTLYRLWQEQNNEYYETFSDESRDGGSTWSSRLKVSSIAGNIVNSSLTSDADGQLYLAQSRPVGDDLVLDVFQWDGAGWTMQELKSLALERDLDRNFIKTGVAPDGTLHVLVSLNYAASDVALENELVEYSRLIDEAYSPQNSPAVFIPTPLPVQPTISPDLVNLTSTPRSPLQFIEDASTARTRNTIGLLLVVGIALLTLILVRPARRKK